MSEHKDDPTEIDATILDHPGKIRLPSSLEVASAVESVPTVEEQRKPGVSTPQLAKPIKVTLPISTPATASPPSPNPTIPIEPARRFDPQATSPTVPGFAARPSSDPTIRESVAPPPPPIAAPAAKPAGTPLVPILAGALAVAVAVIVYLLTRG
ncbi:hypothetical protein L6R52_17000 [Myxococcota bacterium]|nr:hypothetical protein [Myxococcota bacterium]